MFQAYNEDSQKTQNILSKYFVLQVFFSSLVNDLPSKVGFFLLQQVQCFFHQTGQPDVEQLKY